MHSFFASEMLLKFGSFGKMLLAGVVKQFFHQKNGGIELYKTRPFIIQAALVIRGLFICEFAYSHLKNRSKMTIFQSKMNFLSANSRFAVQNDGTYLPRITRETWGQF